MRRNNINDMTICEQLDLIADTMCKHYCKHRDKLRVGKIKKEDLINNICKKCPMTRI